MPLPSNKATRKLKRSASSSGRAPEDDARKGVQSIVRAFAILEAIAASSDGLGLSEISKKVGLHNSTTFNLVRTMLTLGYIRQVRTDKRYMIGRSFFSLAANRQDEKGLASIAEDTLAELSSATGETTHFAMWSGHQVVVVARSDGNGAFRLSDTILGNRPAHATALGKVLLSSLDGADLDRYFASIKLERLTARTIVDEKLLRNEIANIAKERVAYDDGEFHDELRCVAVPVFGFTGHIVGALGVSGPIWRQSMQAVQRQAELLHHAAQKFSAQLGRGGIDAHYSPARHAMKPAQASKEA